MLDICTSHFGPWKFDQVSRGSGKVKICSIIWLQSNRSPWQDDVLSEQTMVIGVCEACDEQCTSVIDHLGSDDAHTQSVTLIPLIDLAHPVGWVEWRRWQKWRQKLRQKWQQNDEKNDANHGDDHSKHYNDSPLQTISLDDKAQECLVCSTSLLSWVSLCFILINWKIIKFGRLIKGHHKMPQTHLKSLRDH